MRTGEVGERRWCGATTTVKPMLRCCARRASRFTTPSPARALAPATPRPGSGSWRARGSSLGRKRGHREHEATFGVRPVLDRRANEPRRRARPRHDREGGGTRRRRHGRALPESRPLQATLQGQPRGGDVRQQQIAQKLQEGILTYLKLIQLPNRRKGRGRGVAPRPLPYPYSPQRVAEVFCELRTNGVRRSSYTSRLVHLTGAIMRYLLAGRRTPYRLYTSTCTPVPCLLRASAEKSDIFELPPRLVGQ